MTSASVGDVDNATEITGGTDQTRIGNTGDRLKVDASISIDIALQNGRLFSASIEVNAASDNLDNPLVLFRNPLASAKNIYLYSVRAGVVITNVVMIYKMFGAPTLTNTVANITNITQTGLSTTVTVTTATNHNATVGATATIAGTVNFNGPWTVVSVTSATVYTFTRTPAPLFTITETTGTSTVNSSLGAALTTHSLARKASPATAVALVNSLPTVSSNGSQMIVLPQAQNSSTPVIVANEISLEPGQNILLTAKPASNNRVVGVTFIWSEAAV